MAVPRITLYDLDAMRRDRDMLLERISVIDADLSDPERGPAEWRTRALRAKAHFTAEYRRLRDAVRRYEVAEAKTSDWELISQLCRHIDDLSQGRELPPHIEDTYQAAQARIARAEIEVA